MNQSQQAAAEAAYERANEFAAVEKSDFLAGYAAALASSPQPAEVYPASRVIEHAEYMATSAFVLLQALETEDEAHLHLNDLCEDDIDFKDADAKHCDAIDARNDAGRALRNRMYEFRKRADKWKASVPAASVETPTTAPWDQKSARERRLALIEELEAESARLTRYTNSPRDGLLAAAARELRDCDAAPAASPSAPAHVPAIHIQQPYTLAEIKAKIASHDYSAEMLLQHAVLLLDAGVVQVPGWKLVPVEASHEMCEAAHVGPNCAEHSMRSSDRAFWEDCYRAMLSASPPPPVSAPTVGEERT